MCHLCSIVYKQSPTFNHETSQLTPPYPRAAFSASPAPWKKHHERAKSAIKTMTREMTTAEVVDSPTPLAPPIVVVPHAQLTPAMIPPNTMDFTIMLSKSHA